MESTLDNDVPRLKWLQYHEAVKQAFFSPFRDNEGVMASAIAAAVKEMDKLKPGEQGGGALLGNDPACTIDFNNIKKSTLPEKGMPLDDVISQVIHMFNGLPNWGHPLSLFNVSPQSNKAAIIASMLAQVFSANTIEGEYAWNTARAELESAGILSNLAGWEQDDSGGIYTYGGSGCWLYHLKYALTRVLPGSRSKGIRTDAKIICSRQAHYAGLNSSDWSGLGMDNVVYVRTVPDSNEMDIAHLEEILADCHEKQAPVASVVCTMGTTDTNAFDPVEAVRNLLDKYPNPANYGKAFLYCDAVIGWAWLAFRNYDFNKNTLGFSDMALLAVEKNYNAVKGIFYADAFGVDFHNYFSPLTSSIFVYKNANEFEVLMKRKGAAYLQPRTPYNPLDYSLEVSRSASGSLAGWATLQSLGHEGFQAILGSITEHKLYLLAQLQKHNDIVCVNNKDYGPATLIRIYGRGVNAKKQYANELTAYEHRDELIRNNQLIYDTGELLWKWFREGKRINKKCTAYLSVTTGFRPATYNEDMKDEHAVIYAIKIYPVNVFLTNEIMDHALNCIIAARDEVTGNE